MYPAGPFRFLFALTAAQPLRRFRLAQKFIYQHKTGAWSWSLTWLGSVCIVFAQSTREICVSHVPACPMTGHGMWRSSVMPVNSSKFEISSICWPCFWTLLLLSYLQVQARYWALSARLAQLVRAVSTLKKKSALHCTHQPHCTARTIQAFSLRSISVFAVTLINVTFNVSFFAHLRTLLTICDALQLSPG